MTLSIIIPTKNEARFLPGLFDSLRIQTYRDFEVIVADAQSSDETRKVARDNGAIIVDGGMPGKGRNCGAVASRGDVLLFLDADVVLPNDRFLEDAMKEFIERQLDIATTKIAPISNHVFYRVIHVIYNWYAMIVQLFWPHAPGFCIFARRTAYQHIRGFDETVVFAEDHDFVQRARSAKFRFRILNHPKPILTSIRRFKKDGLVKTLWIYVLAEFHMIFFGSYHDKMPFSYHMGGGEGQVDQE
jgi:glycosyltransferase involved in cell wall biosynthesis